MRRTQLAVIRDLLIVRGEFTVIPDDAVRYWVSAMHSHQRDAAERLTSWSAEPIVAATLFDRSREKDCDDVYVACRWALSGGGEQCLPCLTYALTFDPDPLEREENAGVLLWDIPERWPEDNLLALAASRAHELCKDPEEDIRELAEEYFHEKPDVSRPPPAVDGALGSVAAEALYHSDAERQLNACRKVLAADRALGTCVLTKLYVGAKWVTLQGPQAQEKLQELPAPPIDIPDDAQMAARVPVPPRHSELFGRLLDDWAPGVKDWLELQIAPQNFGRDYEEMGIAAVESLWAADPQLKSIFSQFSAG